MKTSERLKGRLIALGYPVTVLRRMRPGHWQRSSGAWVWMVLCDKGGAKMDAGSSETMADCLAMTDADLHRELERVRAWRAESVKPNPSAG